jgi:hypothetical protein
MGRSALPLDLVLRALPGQRRPGLMLSRTLGLAGLVVEPHSMDMHPVPEGMVAQGGSSLLPTSSKGGMRVAGSYWFRIIAGTDFNRVMTYNDTNGNPVDLTEYSADFYIDLNDSPLIHVSSPDNITLGGVAGTIQVIIPAAMFAAVQNFSDASYRLLLTDSDGGIAGLLAGQFTQEGD